MSFRQAEIDPKYLLLDPNNLRFHDSESFVMADESRFHEESVQERVDRRIRSDEGLSELKRSILKNGFVPVERIVVRPYRQKDGFFLVIEGNRRLAAIRAIIEDHAAGVPVPESTLKSIESVPVVVVEEDGEDEAFRASLMGIRHVSSIRQWGGYQRAKLIAQMRDDLCLEPSDVADRLGLSTHEVNRRYRALKAMNQMQEDEEYGDSVKPNMYPMFHEAVSLPVLREWLSWDDASSEFKNQETLAQFYGLITSRQSEESVKSDPKIQTAIQLRELREILPRGDAKKILLDDTKSLQDAIVVAKKDQLSRLWASDVASAINALDSIGVQELKTLSREDLELLKSLQSRVVERLSDYDVLSAKTK